MAKKADPTGRTVFPNCARAGRAASIANPAARPGLLATIVAACLTLGMLSPGPAEARNIPGAPEARETLDQSVAEEPQLQVADGSVTYGVSGTTGILTTEGLPISLGLGVPLGADAEIDFILFFEVSDPTGGLVSGSYAATDVTGLLLSGIFESLGIGVDGLGAGFTTTGGALAPLFGERSIFLLEFDPGFGLDPFDTFQNGGSYAVSANTMSAVPLPGSLALLVPVVGMLGWAARWRARR